MVLLPSDEWDHTERREFYEAMCVVANRARRSKAKGWFQHISVDDCYRTVEVGKLKAVRIDNDFVIVYTAGTPWYNHSYRILSEMLVIRLREGCNYRKVLSTLDILARIEQCRAIVVGDALTQNKRLARVYQRAGFSSESEQLIKEV